MRAQEVKESVEELLAQRKKANEECTRIRNLRKTKDSPKLRAEQRTAQSTYDLIRRKLRSLGWTSGQTRRPRTVKWPSTIDVQTLRKVVGTDEATRILKLMEVAQVEHIVLQPRQIEAALEWVNGGSLGQKHVITSPVFKKFLLEQPAIKASFRTWLLALNNETSQNSHSNGTAPHAPEDDGNDNDGDS